MNKIKYIVRAYKPNTKEHLKSYSLLEFEALEMNTNEEVAEYVKEKFRLNYERHQTLKEHNY
jgi:hypothetical protein